MLQTVTDRGANAATRGGKPGHSGLSSLLLSPCSGCTLGAHLRHPSMSAGGVENVLQCPTINEDTTDINHYSSGQRGFCPFGSVQVAVDGYFMPAHDEIDQTDVFAQEPIVVTGVQYFF